MKNNKHVVTVGQLLVGGGLLLSLAVGLGLWQPMVGAQGSKSVPQFQVDPFWPKPLPAVRDADGVLHQWVTGEVGATCIDSHDHIFTVNRGFQTNGLMSQEGTTSIPTPPVVVFDTEGNMVTHWGDPAIAEDGGTAVMPNSVHGCFVDYQNNVWIAGNGDGVVQKYTHDGEMLMQIGTKGICDGPGNGRGVYPTCGEPGSNTSRTLLNGPADIAVDPGPDPVTGEPGSVYIADGYGNYRVVVFDRDGNYLRQFGSMGTGPGQFVESGGGHPHCVVLGNDGLVYACDRGQNRIHVFDKVGDFQRTIAIDPPDQMLATLRATDITFSEDPEQTFIYDTDLGSDAVWILDRMLGNVVGGFGHGGHNAGQFTFLHTLVVDSGGNLYVSETINGRRNQKFVKVSD